MHDDWGVVCGGYERIKAQRLALKNEIQRLNASDSSTADSKRAVQLIKQRDDPRHVHDVQNVPLVQELEKRATQQHAQDVSPQVRVVDGVDSSGQLQQSTITVTTVSTVRSSLTCSELFGQQSSASNCPSAGSSRW